MKEWFDLFAYVSGIPLLYFKVGPPVYISLLLVCVSHSPGKTLHPCQSVSLASSVGSGGSSLGLFSWAMGPRAPIPSLVCRDGLPARSGLGGRPVACPSIYVPCVLT